MRLINPYRQIGWPILVCTYPVLLTAGLILAQYGTGTVLMRVIFAVLYNVLFFALVFFTLLHVPASLRRATSNAIFVFMAVFTAVSTIHFALYSQLVGESLFFTLLDSTTVESYEFVKAHLGLKVIALGILSAVPILVASPWRSPSFDPPAALPRLSALAFGLMLTVALIYGGYQIEYAFRHNPILVTARGIYVAISDRSEILEELASMRAEVPVTVRPGTTGAATHVLAIGESATSRHMSVYGYARDTTPNFAELRSELEVVPDACSSRGTTAKQLRELLTFASRDDQEPLYGAPALLHMMRAADFRTYWFSNQQAVGRGGSNWNTIFSRAADVVHFINVSGIWHSGRFDGDLVPLLREALGDAAERRFITIHLLGSHAAYDLRYPPDFARFGGDRIEEAMRKAGRSSPSIRRFNHYDNSILYTDHVLGEILREIRKLPRATLVYLSDHGEALGETGSFWGHIDGTAPRQVYEIPLVFYLSPELKETLGAQLTTLRANMRHPFQSDRLIHSLLDLYGIEFERADRQKSLLQEDYRPGTRYCDTLSD